MDSHSHEPKFYDAVLKQILAKESGKQKMDRTKLIGSWVTLLVILGLVFSGIEIDLGFTTISFIKHRMLNEFLTEVVKLFFMILISSTRLNF